MTDDQAAPRRRPLGVAAVTVVTLVAGVLFGTSASEARHRGSTGEVTSLADLIAERDRQVRALSDEATELRDDVQSLEQERAGSAAVVAGRAAQQLAPQVGTEPVSGPALRVTLDDAGYTAATLPEGMSVNDVVVHQQDLQGVVNALWAGGAEAIMVMDQRIVATSAVQCVGNTLYLQGRVYSPPFTITAVGEPGRMQAALDADPTVTTYRQWAEQVGLGYQVTRPGTVQLPGFSGSILPQHARLATGR